MVNKPGEAWIEDATDPGMKRVEAQNVDDQLIQRLAEQVARVSHRGINREYPLLELLCLMGPGFSFVVPRPPASIGRWPFVIIAFRLTIRCVR